MIRRAIVTTAALAALAAAPVLGQQHRHGQHGDTTASMMRSGMMQGGMMRDDMMRDDMMGMMQAMLPQPRLLLAAGDQLGLTPDQTEKLVALRDQVSEQGTAHMQAAMSAHQAAAEALQGDEVDLGAYEAGLRQATDHMVTARMAMARAAVEARAMLTPGQLEKLDGLVSLMRHMHGGMTTGAMMGSGGHEGGHDTHR